MPLHLPQPSFTGGEVSPALYGRTDLAKYNTALRRARNVNILPQGGLRNRPGTKMVAAAYDSTHAVRLIPFIASSSVAYVIELGQNYARFYTADAQVLVSSATAWATSTAYSLGNTVSQGGLFYYCIVAHTSGTFATDLAAGKWVAITALQIYTSYVGTDLFGIKYAQSGNTMYLAHPSYAPQTLTLNSDSSWTLTSFVNTNGPFRLQNTDANKRITPSAISQTPVTKTISRVDPGTPSGIFIGTPTVSSAIITTSAAHGFVTGDTVAISALTGAMAASLNGNSYSVLLLTSTTFKLCYLGTSTPQNFTTWTGYAAGAGTVSCGSAAPITLTANFSCFQSTHVGALFELIDTIAAQTVSGSFTANTDAGTAIQCGSSFRLVTLGTNWAGKILVQISTDGGVTYTTIQTLQSSSGNNYDLSGDTGASQCLIKVVGDGTTTWANTMTYNLTAESFDWVGVVQILAYTSATSVTANIMTRTGYGTGLGNVTGKTQWSEGAWSAYRGYPSAVAFYQDRLCWAGPEPANVYCSKTANYTEFGVSVPLEDSDPISLTLPARQLNFINALVPVGQYLVAFTTDSEFSIGPGSNGLFAPTSTDVQYQGGRGSASLQPTVVGNEILVMQPLGSVIRNLLFQFSVQGFEGQALSTISQHLFTGYTITDMAYQQEPDSIVWAIRSDGKMLSLTYDRLQEMAAWSWHDSYGTFESVAVIPSSTNGINEPWFVYLLGSTRYICRMYKRDQGTTIEDQFFVDCGLTYDSTAATTITGLSHLNGYAVSVLADGNVITGKTVSGGQITLDVAASVVQVGLPYISDVETMRIESPDSKGTLSGRRVVIPQITLRFWNSRGGYIGTERPSTDGVTNLDPIIQREADDDIQTAIPLKNEDYLWTIQGGYSKDAHVIFRQIHPLPFTLLALIPQIKAGEN